MQLNKANEKARELANAQYLNSQFGHQKLDANYQNYLAGGSYGYNFPQNMSAYDNYDYSYYDNYNQYPPQSYDPYRQSQGQIMPENAQNSLNHSQNMSEHSYQSPQYDMEPYLDQYPTYSNIKQEPTD